MYPLSQSLHTSIYCIHWKNILQIFIMITSIYSCSTQGPLILWKLFSYIATILSIYCPHICSLMSENYSMNELNPQHDSFLFDIIEILQWSGQLFIVLLKNICVFLIPRGCSTLFEQMSLFSKFTQAYDNFIQSLIEKGPLFTKKKIKTWIK